MIKKTKEFFYNFFCPANNRAEDQRKIDYIGLAMVGITF